MALLTELQEAESLSENCRNSVAADVRRRISLPSRTFLRLLTSAATIFQTRSGTEDPCKEQRALTHCKVRPCQNEFHSAGFIQLNSHA